MKPFLSFLTAGALALGLTASASAQTRGVSGGALVLDDLHGDFMTLTTPPYLSSEWDAWALEGFPNTWYAPVPPYNNAQEAFIYSGPIPTYGTGSITPYLFAYWIPPGIDGWNNIGGAAGAWDYATAGELGIVTESGLTNNSIPKWDNTDAEFINSSLSDDGTTVSTGENLSSNDLELPNSYKLYSPATDDLSLTSIDNTFNLHLNTDNVAAAAGAFNVYLDGNATAAMAVTTANTTIASLNNGGNPGIVHASSTGLLSSSLIVNADITNSTINLTTKVTGVLPVANGGSGTGTAFTQGSIVFAGASGVYSQKNADFFWDNTNNRIGLGTATPASTIGDNMIGLTISANDPNGTTAIGIHSDAHQLTIQSASNTNEELELGVNNELGAGNVFSTVQAYNQGTGPETLKLNPAGGSIVTGNGTVTLGNLTTNGVVQTSGGTGLLGIAAVTNAELANSSITVSNGTGIGVVGSPVSLGGTVTISNTGVTSITGTASQVTASASTGAVTLSLPNPINVNTSGTASNVTGTVAIANGGTGQTTANAALNALLPTQTGHGSQYLQSDGTSTSWQSVAGAVSHFTNKASTETVTSSTTFQPDNDITLSVPAGATEVVNGTMYVTSASSTPNIKFEMTSTQNSNFAVYFQARVENGSNAGSGAMTGTGVTTSSTITTITITGGSLTIIQVSGYVTNTSGSASTVTLDWAQNTSNASGTSNDATSYWTWSQY